MQSSGSRWCSRSAPWWSSEASTWDVEGAWGHWCQQAGESIYQIQAPRGKGVPASPFTPCLAPAPWWAVAPFVHVRDTEVKVLLKEAVNRASMDGWFNTHLFHRSCYKLLFPSTVMLAENSLLGTSFYLCLKWTYFGEDHYPLVYNMLLEPIGKAQGKLLSLSMQSTL